MIGRFVLMIKHIIYHYPCPDGVFAALAAYLYFSKQKLLSETRFIPAFSYKPLSLPNIQKRDFVYMLDWSQGKQFLLDVSRNAKKVILLDHHKTCLEDVKSIEKLPENGLICKNCGF